MPPAKFYFILIFSLIVRNGSQAQNIPAANHLLDTFIFNKMRVLKIPGLAVAVIKNGKALKISVYGKANLEWNAKVTVHTNFQIASCTKLLTSTLLLKSIYSGKIKLTDHLSQYIDSIPFHWADIQVKHLISHSSGIPNFIGDNYISTGAVVRSLKDSMLNYLPGQDQHYTQFDFMLLGYIMEKIYGKPFRQILHDEVILPLGMNDGDFDMEEKAGTFMQTNLIKEKATTYYDMKGKMKAYKFLYPQYTYTAGGYYASINDMVNWAIGLDKELLFPQRFSFDLIFGRDSIKGRPGDFTRAGWGSGDEEGFIAAGHSGGPGLADVLRFPKQGYTFIVLSNDGELLPGFARAVASFYIKQLPEKKDIQKFDR